MQVLGASRQRYAVSPGFPGGVPDVVSVVIRAYSSSCLHVLCQTGNHDESTVRGPTIRPPHKDGEIPLRAFSKKHGKRTYRHFLHTVGMAQPNKTLIAFIAAIGDIAMENKE